MIKTAAGPDQPQTTRRWFHMRLSILIPMVLVAWFASSCFAIRLYRASRQKEAIATIKRLNGGFRYEYEYPGWSEPAVPKWLRQLMGDDFFYAVVVVYLQHTNTKSADMAFMRDLPRLKWLFLHQSKVTDAGLRHLKGSRSLIHIYLHGTLVTDAGADNLHAALATTRIVL